MANAVSIPREYFPKMSEFLKRNWRGAERIQFIKGNHGFYNGAKAENFEMDFLTITVKPIVILKISNPEF